MQLSKPTTDLLEALDRLSQCKLTRRNDLGVLLELSVLNNRGDTLEEISFLAKFISKTFGIMTRIGKGGNGYAKLSLEFNEALGKATTLMQSMLLNAPDPTQQHFSAAYFMMTHESLQRLLALCYDLSWYKNWLIDNGTQHHLGDFPP